MYRAIVIFIMQVALLEPTVVWAQTERSQTISQRMKQIDHDYWGGGLHVEAGRNYFVGPRLSVGTGSFRNLFAWQASASYLFANPVDGGTYVSQQQVMLEAAGRVNLLRWSAGSFFAEASAAWHLPTTASYHSASHSAMLIDREIAQSHASLTAILGTQIGSHWQLSAGYVYDLKPAYNQKYLFEHAPFEYEKLHTQIFERGRIVLRLSYHIPFGQ